ncbi:MAG: hypothetical protein CL569_10280 [Alphaproteobacteria bacterium]|nr:hypothetical protein [Alphaproteobacteria bacterium]
MDPMKFTPIRSLASSCGNTTSNSSGESLMLVRFVSLAVLVMIAAHPAHAGWKEANAAYKRGDFATVLENFVPLAEGGDANAQYNVGMMYAQGNGVGRDDFLAMHWFRKAALQERVGA